MIEITGGGGDFIPPIAVPTILVDKTSLTPDHSTKSKLIIA